MAINVLSPRIFNRIAAGEVVEKPASVVKELVENSMDAGATKIKIEIEEGGIKKICISDNGCGISKEDLPLAFLPHATSKIADVDDLDRIGTLGFRGEALASIAAVSMINLSTKTADSESGYSIDADGGELTQIKEVARLNGTTLTMKNLFFNTPVRAKFLRKPKAEEGDVTHLVEKFMFAHPEIEFEYVVDGKTVYNHASGNLEDVIYLVYGKDVFENLLKVDYMQDDVRVTGFVVSPKISRPNRTYQSLIVNGRYVENYMISACVQGAYEPLLMKGRFPIYVLKLEIPLDRVDVNVHPNKKEVKFENQSRIFSIVRRAVEKALVSSNLIADFEFTNQDEEDWSKFSIKNDREPERTHFNVVENVEAQKLSPSEGASFRVSLDKDSVEKEIQLPEANEEKLFAPMPEFASVKADLRNKNKPGGNIFFDHSGDSLLHQVELNVERKQEEKFAKPAYVEDKFLTSDIEEVKVVGVVFKTYIIAEFQDNLYLIDQHAMHERQLYDKLRKQLDENNVSKQDMLIPYSISLVSKDAILFESKMENLRKLGFEVSRKGNSFEISSVPYLLAGMSLEKFVHDVLADDSENEKTASDLINDKLCQTACKHAIKAGDSVGKEEILYLIEKMKESVPLCPHGRPIVAKITKKDLEKMFRRVL